MVWVVYFLPRDREAAEKCTECPLFEGGAVDDPVNPTRVIAFCKLKPKQLYNKCPLYKREKKDKK